MKDRRGVIAMYLGSPNSTWPPERPPDVPPYRPQPPREPPPPERPVVPILPTWEELHPKVPDQDIVDRLLGMRIIQLGGYLDTAMANRATAQLLLLGNDERPIDLHLTCGDSDLDASLALADTIETISAPVHVIAHGTVTGPAVAVLCTATERAARPGTTIILSLPRAFLEGRADQLTIQAEQHERQVTRLRDMIAGTTGHDARDVEEDLRTGRLLTADESLDCGLLTRLL
jgi:ATP-dependent Clp protease protease subunit